MSNVKEISKLMKFIKKSKQFTIIHTQLDNDINLVNLRVIPMLKKKFGMNIAYGNHCKDLNVIYLALGFEPSDLLFYVKGQKMKKHIDDPHAYELNKLYEIIQNLRNLPNAIGDEVKIKMKGNIN